MAYDEQQLRQALLQAHNAGDTEAAQMFADKIKAAPAEGYGTQKSLGQLAMGMVSGADRREFDIPGAGPAAGFKASAASMFGNDEDFERALEDQGEVMRQDKFGNAMFTDEEGQDRYVNRPGLEGSDIIRGIGKVASFVPAGRAAAMPASLGGRIAAGAGAAGATDVAMQGASGRDAETFDPGQTAMVAAGGAVAEALVPVAHGVKQLLTAGKRIEAGKQLAHSMGLADDLSNAQYKELADYAAANVDDALNAGRAEFGFEYTQGQRTGNVNQLAREERLANTTGTPQRLFAGIRDRNQQAATGAIDDFQSQLGTGTAQTADDAAQIVGQGLKRSADDLKSQVDDAYGAARQQKAFVNTEATDGLSGKLRESVRDFSITSDDVASNKVFGIVDELSAVDAKAVSLKALETKRRQINNAIGSASSKSDRAAAIKMKGAFDDWVDESVETALYSGDEAALNSLKTARGLRSEYARRFEDPKEVAKLLEGREAPEIAQMLYSSGSMGKGASSRVAREVKRAVGDDSEAWKGMREMVFLKAVQNPKTGEQLGAQAVVSNLKAMLRGKNKYVAQELYTPEELSKLGRFLGGYEATLPKAGFRQSSGTSERFWRFASGILGDTPFAGGLMKLAQTPAALRATSQAAPRAASAAAVPVGSTTLPEVYPTQ